MTKSHASGRGWALRDASTIPSLWNVGGDGVAIDEEEAFGMIAERDPGIIERWEEIERRHPGYEDEVEYHSIRQHFGIRAFGVAAWTCRPVPRPTAQRDRGGLPP
jgi:hypothetical protein